MELQRQHNEPLNDLEEEAKERAQHLLEKANEQRQEQEDEIKHLNEVQKLTEATSEVFIRVLMLTGSFIL